ncbi:MAG: tachylectin-related carbohydrate-binding protein [Actinophytocola sp.]|uniref:tachylectin-related carbohydrate-binding protein n=1 Tax=Actinophytocola sp. TaxID=1872138 RepID=UPI003C73C54E
MRLARISTLVAVCTVAASVATVPPTAAATENSTLECTPTAPIYRVTSNGIMYHYQHTEPETGADLAFVPNPPIMGTGWNLGRPVAAPNGVIYMAWNDGALRRYRWNGTGWDTFQNGNFFEIIEPGGWAQYNTASYRNRITVDSEGHIYTVEPDGHLHWRGVNPTTSTWEHRVLAGQWGQFDLIVAAGRGVLYARTTAGALYRYRYDAASQRWLMFGKQVGHTWNIFDRVLSAGGDVLYAVQPDGKMYWYRWDENTEAWISNVGKIVGAGWIDWATSGMPNSCQRIGTSTPTRPAVPAQPNGPVTLLNTSDGHLHYGYVDPEGRATHAEAVDLTGDTPFGAQVVPGLTGVSATTAMGEYQDGRVVLSANGTDADVLESVRGADDVWSAPTKEGGFLVTAPTTARLSGGILAEFGLAADYGLWVRRQVATNAPFGGWQFAGSTPLDHQRLTAVSTSAGVRLVGLGRDGQFRTATYENGVLSDWTSLGGSGFTGTASVVEMPGNTVQVFATDSTGTVQTQRQTATGFPGTWTALPGIAASGSPSAVMSIGGMLQVVTRGPGNYIYYRGQTAPSSTTWTAWQPITLGDETSTDPSALTVPSAGTWVVAYLTDTNEPKLRRAPASVARSTSPGFVEVPIQRGPLS